jgi:hypothetical protein
MDYLSPDSNGYVPDPDLIGTKWVHCVRQTAYEILDFIWNCDKDIWHVQYKSLSIIYPIKFSRSVECFFGLLDGVPRYSPFP